MRNTKKILGITALVAVILFSMASCDNGTTNGGGSGGDNGNSNSTLSGDITISPNNGVSVGT